MQPADAFAHRDLGFHLKVRWFRDLLRHGPARRHLWSLYFHGEAYEDLHPLGVWIDKLPERYGRALRRQLDDENRHAVLFEALLSAEGHAVTPLQGTEDVGWFSLHTVVPDVCAAAGRGGPFTEVETMRYLGFLHALETRSVIDLCALRDAAEAEQLPEVVSTVETILKDERWHAAWTWNGLCRLAGSEQAALEAYAPIRRAERAATGRVVRTLLARFESLGAAPTGLARLRWWAMGLVARLSLAVPELPVFDPRGRVPRTLLPTGA